MRRGFGIDAAVPTGVAAEVASIAEQAGFASFWVNGSPPGEALDSLQAAAESSNLDLGVGVLPLTDISADEIADEMARRRIPAERLWLGIGSSRRPGALAEVRSAVSTLRSRSGARIVTAAVGPRMTALAGEVADAVLFTWWTVPAVQRSRHDLEAGADSAGRRIPQIASYIRCALLPEASAAFAERAATYAAIPRYAEVFARHGTTAAATVVTGETAADLRPGIEREESVLDVPIIRAIPADTTVESIARVVEATAPTA